ncbi:hypothetical protein BK816_03830 [Boudabousia tangfeifanii]|uniref:Dihydrofolate synthase/folylpolyglutamate synthase n=1 Tax=Boudabousia tangfeifanii TaxID=1912795 RepID=A0A1D9MJR7_9ACTO|nr:folylpolyglutamate synthase/dihydrofolate synthase family protein [Boudabousia tangfeifanii]AOZ72532.1 hypothetical protein BK816_03830 [Boudabousia tangfeifanii]
MTDQNNTQDLSDFEAELEENVKHSEDFDLTEADLLQPFEVPADGLTELFSDDSSVASFQAELESVENLPQSKPSSANQNSRLYDNAKEREMALRVEEIYQSIIARAPEHKVQPSLERVEMALDLMGNPQQNYPCIHLTGTNGKTSTSRMIDSLISARDLTVGRFTSPHLSNVRERISIGGQPISQAAFISAWEDIEPFIQMVDAHSEKTGGVQMSFFEVFTVMAFAAFAAAPVDVAVIEVGMGGTWDATNVISAPVSVFTPISLDHEKWLGATLAEIAEEKSGIIKPHATVVMAEQVPEVAEIILAKATQMDASVRHAGVEMRVVDRQLGVGGQMLTLQTQAATYTDIALPLFGRHQAENALLALGAVEAFFGGGALPAEVVEAGFAKATSPGRLEVVKGSPTVLVDAAHNVGGAQVLRRAIDEAFAFERVYGVFAAMADKNVEGILGELEPLLDQIVLTPMDSPRAMPLEELQDLAVDVFGEDRVHVAQNLPDALDKATALSQEVGSSLTANGVLVCGSVVLAGQARQLCGVE